MKFIIFYKLVYIILLIGNLIFPLLRNDFQFNPSSSNSIALTGLLGFISITSICLLINSYNFQKIFHFKLSKVLFKLELLVSISRILMTLTIALKFGYITMVFSPISQIFWIPILTSLPFKGTFNFGEEPYFTLLQLICLILIILELYYVWLLKKIELS